MKRYYDYEDHEILQMTDEDIDKLIEIECAVAGAPLRMEQPVPPQPSAVEPDVTTYTVPAGTLRFANKETALAAVEFLNGLSRMRIESIIPRSYGAPYRVESDDSELSVGTERNWSDVHYATHAKAIKDAKAAKDEYDRARREYDDAHKKREASVKDVYDHVRHVRDRDADRRHCRQTFASYLELAEGQQEIALSFMLKTAERYDEAFIRETLNFPKTETLTKEDPEDGTEQEKGRAAADDGRGEDDSPEF